MLFDPPKEKNLPVQDFVSEEVIARSRPTEAAVASNHRAAVDPTKITKANSAIPGVTESGMFFEVFIFHPDPSISKADLIEVLKAAKFTFPTSTFEKLPDSVKSHFLRLDRTGAVQPVRKNRSQ